MSLSILKWSTLGYIGDREGVESKKTNEGKFELLERRGQGKKACE